jgi:hypothetical protein
MIQASSNLVNLGDSVRFEVLMTINSERKSVDGGGWLQVERWRISLFVG